MATKTTVITVEDGKKGEQKETVEADRYLVITEMNSGEFKVLHNQLRTTDLLGLLALTDYQVKQDFRARNYGTTVLRPKE